MFPGSWFGKQLVEETIKMFELLLKFIISFRLNARILFNYNMSMNYEWIIKSEILQIFR